MSVFCDGASCCPCPPESEAVLKRDGVLYLICTECKQEKGPAPEITQIACERAATTAAPCSDYNNDGVWHRWEYL